MTVVGTKSCLEKCWLEVKLKIRELFYFAFMYFHNGYFMCFLKFSKYACSENLYSNDETLAEMKQKKKERKTRRKYFIMLN